ncbi:hypothetical protein OAO01_08615 [Oligoflexia bacterium]|nr:hypothetical protein [Oligoflexia bacterium]
MPHSHLDQSSSTGERRPFGGCRKLLGNYKAIGFALLQFEDSSKGDAATEEFRVDVSFVSIEALEAYLEDLLDLKISEDILFLNQDKFRLRASHFFPVGIAGAMALGIYAASRGASLLLSLSLALFMAVPFALFWQLSPHGKTARRMLFAKVVSHEISRRRGDDDSDEERPLNTLTLRELFSRRASGSATGAACSVVKH